MTSFETNLFRFRGIEGNKNESSVDIIREFEHALSKDEGFIGAGPIGSSIKGYSQKDSDEDIRILVDSSKYPDQLAGFKRLERTAKETSLLISQQTKKKITIMLHDVNISSIDYLCRLDNMDEMSAVIISVADLSRMVSGHQVERYREAVKKSLDNLSLDSRQKVLKKVLDLLVESERGGVWKYRERSNETDSNPEELLQKRKTLWQDRLNKLWIEQ